MAQITDILNELGIEAENRGTFAGSWLPAKNTSSLISRSPVDSAEIGSVGITDNSGYELALDAAIENFVRWRVTPAPVRGQVIREIAAELRRLKTQLGTLVSYEMGKLLVEGQGEIQEIIDIADFACGLSRQLYGRTMHSERAQHRMYEQWHPLGVVGVITAFNFPAAVWGWNSMIAAVCGNSTVWKPSELTPLTAVALIKVCERVASQAGFPALFTLITGESEMGQRLAADPRINLVSATGSTAMGRAVGETVARRVGRSLLELGGNNAVIVLTDANLDLAVRAVVFGAVGTAGQRCTSTRRVIVEQGIKEAFLDRLVAAYRQVKIGNPLEEGVLMGPLINGAAREVYRQAIERAISQGGSLLFGGEVLEDMPSSLYVKPAIVLVPKDSEILQHEIFAPILFILEVDSLAEAITAQNNVPQGLSSAIFTESLRSAEQFLSSIGSDCGIANVNIGTSGAEIGGAFGGEKESGGGREAGSDCWKQYMRRQTSTINWGTTLPLAQGIEFESKD